MPADLVFRTVTVAPGRQTVWFTYGWQPGDHPNRGPILFMASPDSPTQPDEDTKLVIEDYGQVRSKAGPVYYAGLISNLGDKPVGCRIMGVYFPEFQQDWEM
jgi:hypothetical protein